MFAAFGHLSAQMLVHVLLMNAVAPLLALAASAVSKGPRGMRRPLRGRGGVFPPMIVQLTALWTWHAPPVLEAAMTSTALHLGMQASLLLSAAWFWAAVLSTGEDQRWQSVLALLVTSKLFCLLGVLLVFAPRPLYPAVPVIADQQLAGLLMLISCPLAYVASGVVIAGRWLAHIDAAGRPNGHRQNAQHAV